MRHRTPDTPRPRHRRFAAAALLSSALGATLLAGAAAGPAGATGPAPAGTTSAEPWNVNSSGPGPAMLFETFSPSGRITLERGVADHPTPTLPVPARVRQDATAPGGPTLIAMHQNGPSTNRIDLIFIGDGYTAAEMPVFAQSAENAWKALMTYEPYKTYQNFFNGWRIEVPSPVSGISNDPTNGIARQTPLGMHFFCHGIDRLLCVNTTAASAYAKLKPGVSHVISIAHTTTYGGAGGSITTLAGENQYSDGVIVHEMAHTIGGLGDEYQVPYDTATDSEAPGLSNVSARTVDYMLANKFKWWRWLGAPAGDGTTVGAYEGANYYNKGFFRPTNDSEMRTLGKPFNPPSAEALIEAFYVNRAGMGSIDGIDSVTPVPDNNGIANRNTTLSVSTIPLVGQTQTIYWGVGGVAVPGSLGQTTLNLATAPLTRGQWNQVSVYVIDNNPAVKDTDFRTKSMTSTRLWWVWGG